VKAKGIRFAIACAGLVPLFLLQAGPAQARTALDPGEKQGHYVRWYYPSQIAYGPLETGVGNTRMAPAPSAFLTLPFMGPHYVTSLFDHCYPDYVNNGKLCRYDGEMVSSNVGGPDPTFSAGYAQTPGQQDYLYYDGHDGYDYGLTYEPVAAAAPGKVILAGWLVPNCHSCLSGLTVEIDHGNGLLSFYGHMSRIDVRGGQYVQRGQVLGLSGMTGTATGPHLHFGVYYMNGNGPVDPYGWSGSYPDPYQKDLGDLWLSGSPRYADVPLPNLSVKAVRDPSNPTVIDVSWSSPGAGNAYTIYVVGADGVLKPIRKNVGAGSLVYQGKPDLTYWFWGSVKTNLGWTDGGGSSAIRVPRLNLGQPV